jgi:lipoic acid synthetase
MKRKPEWLKISNRKSENRDFVNNMLDTLGLNTVCSEAMCPNQWECYENKTATFMILGTNCTRNCRFCNVEHQSPQRINPNEPKSIGVATKELGLSYIVVTSVTRDDLPDGGAGQFVSTIYALREHCPDIIIEVLIPDFKGDLKALEAVVAAKPDVISHNMETVPALYEQVRPEAIYTRSLKVLEDIKKLETEIYSKSSLMVGLGETKEQVIQVMDDLLRVKCDFLTIGQYLAPSKAHYPVIEYIHPDMFEDYKRIALEKGFKHVARGPFVRSSYGAHEAMSVR